MCTHGGPRGAMWNPVFGLVLNVDPPHAVFRLLRCIFMAGMSQVNCRNQILMFSELFHTIYFVIPATYTVHPTSIVGHVHTGPAGYPQIH